MQQIVRRLRPAREPLTGRRGPLPSYLLFAPDPEPDEWGAPAPVPVLKLVSRRGRTSTPLLLENASCLS